MKKKIDSFTGLRFVMIVLIIIRHCNFFTLEDNFGSFALFYKTYLWEANLPVNFFFIISGFGMMYSSLVHVNVSEMEFPKLKDGLNYGIKHIKKIYPLYIGTILFGLIAGLCFEVYNENPLLHTFVWNKLIQLLFAIPLIQSATGITQLSHAFNGVAWFLSSLFCIYLVSPWLIYYLRKKSKTLISDVLYFISFTFIAVILIRLMGKIETIILSFGDAYNCSLVYSSPYRRVFYVLTGMCISLIFYRLHNKKNEISFTMASLFEICIVVITLLYHFLRNTLPGGYYLYVIDIIICSVLVFIFAYDKGIVSQFMAHSYMQKLGNMVMYIYLIHYPIRIWVGRIVEDNYGWNVVSAIILILSELIVSYVLSLWIYNRNNQNKRSS